MGDDQNSGAVQLGWEFPFWDRVYRQVFLDTDGWMSFSFGGQNIGVEPNTYPVAVGAGQYRDATIAMANLDNVAGTDVYFWTNGQDMAVMQWLANHTNQYEVILYANGMGKIQYGPNAAGRSGAVGVNLGDGRHGWYISAADNNRFVEGYVWAFGPAGAWSTWLTADPTEGTLAAGESMDVTLTIDPADLDMEEQDHYQAMLHFLSNDPATPDLVVDVYLRLGIPDPIHYVDVAATDNFHTLTVTDVTFDNEVVPLGWEVGVFTPDDVLAGSAVWVGGDPIEFMTYGAQDDVPGFAANDDFRFEIWDPEADFEWNATATFAEGDPTIWNNGASSALTLASFSVVEQVLAMTEGWNMISINVDPIGMYAEGEGRGPDIETMFAQLANEDGEQNIDLLKDEMGHFWSPAWGFINIDFWELTDGYQVKVFNACEAVFEGNAIAANADIPINPNWNLIAYFPNYALDASSEGDFYVLSPIIDYVQIAKNNLGHFMTPEWGFSNMEPWVPGQGYQLKSTAEEQIILNYPGEQRHVAYTEPFEAQTGHWTAPLATGANMSVLIHSLTGVKVEQGDQIAAFSPSGLLVGVSDITGGNCGLAVWGDDPSTESLEGLARDEAFRLSFWDADKQVERDLGVSVVLAGRGLAYEADDFIVVDVIAKSVVPANYFLSQNYPNPFNSETRLTFGMPEAGDVSINVYDVAGRLVQNVMKGRMDAGTHVAVVNGRNLAAGVYIIRMESTDFSVSHKMMLVK